MTVHKAGDKISFDDGTAYELFMGRWSRLVGERFLNWLDSRKGAHWLELGCGTGAFTRLLTEKCQPGGLVSFDPSEQQVVYARKSIKAEHVTFRIGSAESLPCADATFDYVVSALAINFMADRAAAAREMCRVVRAGGTVAGYVWDFASQKTPHGPLVRGLGRLGIVAPHPPGGSDCAQDSLHKLFAEAGLSAIETTTIEIEVNFANFDEFWTAQRPGFSPTTRLIEQLTELRRRKLVDVLHAELPVRTGGRITYAARANAVKGRLP